MRLPDDHGLAGAVALGRPLLLSALALASCVEAEPVAVVVGRITIPTQGMPAGLTVAEVHARGDDGALGGSDAVAADGSWLLVLPLGTWTVALEARDGAGQRSAGGGDAFVLEVCAASELVETPPITVGPRGCSGGPACVAAREDRNRCAHRPACDAAEGALASCLSADRGRCGLQITAFEGCRATRPEEQCGRERDALMACRGPGPVCASERDAVTSACVVACAEVIAAEQTACGAPGDCLPDGIGIDGAPTSPIRVGCGGGQ